MTLEEQLPLLLKAFRELQPKPPPRRHSFIAGGQTFAIADFRRMADSTADRAVGDVLHVLLDALEARQEHHLRHELAAQLGQLGELRDLIKSTKDRIIKSQRLLSARSDQGKAIEQVKVLLQEARDELKESS